MDQRRETLSGPAGRLLWCAVLVLALDLAGGPAPAAAFPPGTRAPVAVASAPLLATGWSWQLLYRPIESLAGNRRRMIQLATVGMCIGLYILMRR